MEFQDVIRRRRMVRQYDTDRPVPRDVVDRILQNGLRAPSAGFSQGWAFLVLDDPGDVARFRDAVRSPEDPDGYFAARVEAPLVIVAHSNKDAYWTATPSRTRGTRIAATPGGRPRTGISTRDSRPCRCC